jgi:hypothetical protein
MNLLFLTFIPGILIYKTEIFFIPIYVDNNTLYGPSSPMMNIKNILTFKFEVIVFKRSLLASWDSN